MTKPVTVVLVSLVAFAQLLEFGASLDICAFGFPSVSDNRSFVPTWTVPIAEPYGQGESVLNEGYPIAAFESDDPTANITCTGISSSYHVGNNIWSTEVDFPVAEGEDTESIPMGDMFHANGTDLWVSSVPASMAVALYDSLYGREVRLDVTCTDANGAEILPTVDDGDSCILFELNFTNYSPLPDTDLALFRFEDPIVPGFVLPPANTALNTSPGDIQLNVDNPIVQRDGTNVTWGCNGDQAEYLGEDGLWYYWFTGRNGQTFNLSHVFYATEYDHVNIATIQRLWSPNMESMLYNRTVRLLIHCSNTANFEEGYLFFRVGEVFEESCETVPELCVLLESSGASPRHSASFGALGGVGGVATMGMAAWHFGAWIIQTFF